MDDVLVDFHKSSILAQKLDEPYSDIIRYWPRGQWGIPETLGLYESDFWSNLDSKDFWANLTKLPWADALVEFGLSNFEQVRIITHPVETPACYAGKRASASQHFGDLDLILCREKWLMASEDRVLVDDKEENVQLWRESSGPAVLFPRVWNSLYRYAEDPIDYVIERLKEL